MSAPQCLDLTADLHSAQLKKALTMFHLFYYSFWASLFKDLQDPTFPLSLEWKQALRSNWFAFSLPTTVPEIPAYRALLNMTLCHSLRISGYEILPWKAMKTRETVIFLINYLLVCVGLCYERGRERQFNFCIRAYWCLLLKTWNQDCCVLYMSETLRIYTKCGIKALK